MDIKQDEEVTIEFIITKGEFSNSEEFSIFIEKEAKQRKFGYLETLLEYCENRDIEPSSLAKSITSSLKQKIQAEAETLNLLKSKQPKLP